MDEEGTTRPSSRAVERLASDVGGEVTDLRAALRRALDEADRHEADGRPDRAAAVLAEQQEVLAAVHQRLEDRLAEAAVEREAEGVLAAVEPAPAPGSDGSLQATEAAGPSHRDEEGMGLRLLASAAAAVVGVVLLLSPEAGVMLTVAGWSSVEEPGATDAGRADDQEEARDASADGSPAVAPTWPALHDLAIPEAPELRPAPEVPAGGPVAEDTQQSPSEPVDGPIDEVLDELGDLDEVLELEDLDSTDDGQSGPSEPASEDDAGTEDDGAANDTSDQQDESALEGSSTTTGLDDIAPSDDETAGAGR